MDTINLGPHHWTHACYKSGGCCDTCCKKKNGGYFNCDSDKLKQCSDAIPSTGYTSPKPEGAICNCEGRKTGETEIYTLGVFDYESIVKTFSQVTNAQVILDVKKQTPEIPNLTKPIIDRVSVRLALAWQKYWECVNKCRLRQNILEKCPGCDSVWPSWQAAPPTEPPSPPTFPCCNICVAEKCIIATGNEECSLGGGIPNGELLLIAQTLCFQDRYQEFIKKLDCYECVQNEYVDCSGKCSRPAGPEPSLRQVTDALS